MIDGHTLAVSSKSKSQMLPITLRMILVVVAKHRGSRCVWLIEKVERIPPRAWVTIVAQTVQL